MSGAGAIFSVYRMMGESHLDAEPYKEDTEKMKKASKMELG